MAAPSRAPHFSSGSTSFGCCFGRNTGNEDVFSDYEKKFKEPRFVEDRQDPGGALLSQYIREPDNVPLDPFPCIYPETRVRDGCQCMCIIYLFIFSYEDSSHSDN